MRTYNDWYPETKALLDRLTAHGVVLLACDDGEERTKFDGDLDKFIAQLTACDECCLYVKTPSSSKTRWIYLVFGNSPGELPADYVVDPTLDAVTTAHYDEWSLKPQPIKQEALTVA